MTVEFKRERFQDVYLESKPLLERHWEEIARNKDFIKLVPDVKKYEASENMGILRCLTARENGILIGYAVYFVTPHLHYSNNLWAFCDIIWIAPEHRKGMLGIRLIRFVEQFLKDEGVHVIHTIAKLAHPALGKILGHLGHNPIETVYAKVLKEDR